MKSGKNKANKHEKAGNGRPGKEENGTRIKNASSKPVKNDNKGSKPCNKEKGTPGKKENRRQVKNGNGKLVKENGTLGKKEKKYLLELARDVIESSLKPGEKATEGAGKNKKTETAAWKGQAKKTMPVMPPTLLEPGACFVTLHLCGELRGCIGSLEAYRPLVQDVASNALNSAFRDPRFAPVTSEELKAIKISISVLTKPKPLEMKDAKDLLLKLKAGKHGLTLRKGSRSATFLPAVWEELPEKADFLSHLCYKAGLPPDAWKNTKSFEFETYEANEFSE